MYKGANEEAKKKNTSRKRAKKSIRWEIALCKQINYIRESLNLMLYTISKHLYLFYIFM